MSFGYKPELSEGAVKPPVFKPLHLFLKLQEEGKHFLKKHMD